MWKKEVKNKKKSRNKMILLDGLAASLMFPFAGPSREYAEAALPNQTHQIQPKKTALQACNG